jgi:hypothetical protein
MCGSSRQLNHELIDWQAATVIGDPYREIMRGLGDDHPAREAVCLLGHVYFLRVDAHEIGAQLECEHPGGLWGELGENQGGGPVGAVLALSGPGQQKDSLRVVSILTRHGSLGFRPKWCTPVEGSKR